MKRNAGGSEGKINPKAEIRNPKEIRRPKSESCGKPPSQNGSPNSGYAVIALGSNLGDSSQILQSALKRLATLSQRALQASSLWSTSPVDCPPGSPPFINAVAIIHPLAKETPETLLTSLKKLEAEFGRTPKTVLNEPRPLDLDLITFGNITRQTAELTLPHPRAHQRRFVLQPLAEIAPELILPGQTQTVVQLLKDLPDHETVHMIDRR